MIDPGQLAAMRETSERALPDQVTIIRPSSTGTLDPVTGEWTPDPPLVVYDGAARVRAPSANETRVLWGGEQVNRTRYVATFPHNLPEVELGDRVAVTFGSDPHFAGLSLLVVKVASGSWLIDRRIGLEDAEDA